MLQVVKLLFTVYNEQTSIETKLFYILLQLAQLVTFVLALT